MPGLGLQGQCPGATSWAGTEGSQPGSPAALSRLWVLHGLRISVWAKEPSNAERSRPPPLLPLSLPNLRKSPAATHQGQGCSGPHVAWVPVILAACGLHRAPQRQPGPEQEGRGSSSRLCPRGSTQASLESVLSCPWGVGSCPGITVLWREGQHHSGGISVWTEGAVKPIPGGGGAGVG